MRGRVNAPCDDPRCACPTGEPCTFSSAASLHPCPKGKDCALNSGAVHCFHCRRNWPRDETWDVPFDQRPDRHSRDAASKSGDGGALTPRPVEASDGSPGRPSPSAASKRRRKPRRAAELGIDDDLYEQLLEAQNGGCAICGAAPKTRRLHVDHDHATRAVRGLLCFRCNRALPTYASKEWLAAASLYVAHGGVPTGSGLRHGLTWLAYATGDL